VNEIKPSTAVYKRALGASAAIFIPLLLVNLVSNRSNPILFVVVMIVTLAITLFFIWLYFRNTRYSADALQVTRKNLFGSLRTFPFSEMGTIIFAHEIAQTTAITTPSLIVLGLDGKKLFRLNGSWWSGADMAALLNATGKTADVIVPPISPADLKRRHPTALSWGEAHPWALAFIVAGGVLVVAFGGIAIALATLFS
jgi:hypothetical protein